MASIVAAISWYSHNKNKQIVQLQTNENIFFRKSPLKSNYFGHNSHSEEKHMCKYSYANIVRVYFEKLYTRSSEGKTNTRVSGTWYPGTEQWFFVAVIFVVFITRTNRKAPNKRKPLKFEILCRKTTINTAVFGRWFAPPRTGAVQKYHNHRVWKNRGKTPQLLIKLIATGTW